MKVRGLIFASALASAAFATSGAHAASRIGTLDCDISGGVGLIIGSNKGAVCRFIDQRGRRVETYVGNVAKLGLDLGVTAGAKMIWAVWAETTRPGRGALAGDYTGASADASLGVGGGAKVLIGGSRQTITLQPLSVQAQAGVNVAVGVESLALRPAARR